jgi:hypothetical protein
LEADEPAAEQLGLEADLVRRAHHPDGVGRIRRAEHHVGIGRVDSGPSAVKTREQGSACPCLPGHCFWRPSTGRRSEQHDPFLQESGDDRRVPLLIALGPGGVSLNSRAG